MSIAFPKRGKYVNILNVISPPVSGPVNVKVQSSEIQKSSPSKVHQQPVLPSSLLSLASNTLYHLHSFHFHYQTFLLVLLQHIHDRCHSHPIQVFSRPSNTATWLTSYFGPITAQADDASPAIFTRLVIKISKCPRTHH